MTAVSERAPKIFPEKKGFSINRKLAAIALTGSIAASGIGIWAAANQGEQNKPEPTPVGGIGNVPTPSPEITPRPTLSNPTESPVVIVTPSPSPVETPEPTKELSDITKIKEVDYEKTTANTVESSIDNVYKSYPELINNDTYPKDYIDNNWDQCINGLPEDANDPKLLKSDKLVACSTTITQLYYLYTKTGNQELYDTAVEVYNFALTSLGKDIKPSLDELF